jgi:hypothetical protein
VVATVPTVIPFELSAAVLPVSPGVVFAGAAGAGGDAGAAAAGDGTTGAGAGCGLVEGIGEAAGGTSVTPVAGGIAGGIVAKTAGITGVSGVTGGCDTAGTCGPGSELIAVVTVATIVAGSTGTITPSSARAGLAASAATAPHTERLRTIDERRDMIQEDMYPGSERRIQKNEAIKVSFIFAA